MSRNNDVFQVLVTTGNQAVLTAGNRLGDLAVGQIGVFDFETGLSINASSSVRNFFLAVGLDDGTGSLGDVRKSSGSHVQKGNIRFYSFREHSAARPMIVEVSNITGECDTEYGIKLEFRNQEIYRTQGYNQFAKTYVITTGCCTGCETGCPTGDANEVVKLFKAEINGDTAGLATATAHAAQAVTIATHGTSADYSTGDEVSDADVDVMIAFNEGEADPANHVFTNLRLTTVPQAVNSYCSVNLKYFYPRQTIVVPSLVEGFSCAGTLSTIQTAAFEEGNGYDIQRLEFEAGGWNGKPGPYRLSELTGVANETEYLADKTVKYAQIALTYDQFSVGGWLEYLNNLATIVAIPEADTTTRDGLIAILDALLTPAGFDELANDAAAATTTTTTVSPTADIDDTDLDGIA